LKGEGKGRKTSKKRLQWLKGRGIRECHLGKKGEGKLVGERGVLGNGGGDRGNFGGA